METKHDILFVVLGNDPAYYVLDTTSTLGYIMQSKNELREFLLSFDYANDSEVDISLMRSLKGLPMPTYLMLR